MNQVLMYGTFAFLGLVVVLMLLSVVLVARNKTVSIWINRGMYAFGALAVLLNLIRMFIAFSDYKGTMVFANVIVLISLIISAGRQEMARKMPPEENEEE